MSLLALEHVTRFRPLPGVNWTTPAVIYESVYCLPVRFRFGQYPELPYPEPFQAVVAVDDLAVQVIASEQTQPIRCPWDATGRYDRNYISIICSGLLPDF